MKISVNWAQRYSNVDLAKGLSVDELVAKIGAQLGEVDEVFNVGQKYQHIVISRVVSCQKHPNADKLSLCKIDDGGVVKSVKRDENGLVQVVCGAPNVREGLTVAWLPPGAIVPSTYDKEQFTLEARELRGEVSNGMLASAAELALSEDHSGILEITENVAPGTLFAEHYQLNDTIVDVENKMFTHRPDCFGILGVARELAGIQGKAFVSPSWYLKSQAPKPAKSDAIRGYGITIEIGELCPRYMLIGMDNVKIAPSPVWLQSFLSRVGIRPINNIVDMTNYLMYLTGQPLHAFDFDKVAKDGVANIVVRKPRKGEKLGLLDGKTITPRKDAILICDQDKPIALGGVMGGNNSEIDETTTRILIECANFDMYNIRRTAMEHGLFTDSVTRFNKGQSPWQCPAVLYKAVEMVQELSKGAVAVGKAVDGQDKSVERHNKPVTITPQFINERLGLKLTTKDITTCLHNVEFDIAEKKGELHITAPFWRTDIAIPEDIVEEVGRLLGYDTLPKALPQRSLLPAAKNPEFELKTKVRNILASAGANEVLTYNFVHGDLLKKAGQDPAQAFELSNALSPDLQYFRMGLTPSLLDKVHPNIKAGFDEFALFELNKTHNKLHAKDGEDKLPKEFPLLALVFAANTKAAKQYDGAAFYQAKRYLDYLAQALGFSLVYEPITKELPYPVVKPYNLKRSAMARVAGSDIELGLVGEFKPSVAKGFKLPAFCAGFELGLPELQKAIELSGSYQPLSKYPKTQQDISFKVKSSIKYQRVYDVLEVALAAAEAEHGYEWTIEPLDIYQEDPGSKTKHLTFRITLNHFERTLTTKETNALMDELAEVAARAIQAKRL